MFTGIVEELGIIDALVRGEGRARMTVACSTVLDGAAVGDSIAVNGCCLTVTAVHRDNAGGGAFDVVMMGETLARTSLGDRRAGDAVNLERAMTATDRFGGHLVQGHVDAVGDVVARTDEPGTTYLTVDGPDLVAGYVVPQGSIAVDGVSLTVVDLAQDGFRVALIPHTLEVTTLRRLRAGDRVNLEADLVAKYVARILSAAVATPDAGDARE